MNIAVLCGGLSPEREVSITSGKGIANALRERGHKVVLMDLFFGYTGTYEKPEEIFTETGKDEVKEIDSEIPDIEKMAESSATKSKIGDNVIEICSAADIVFMALHGEDGENGKLQSLFDIYGIKYTGTGPLGSAMAMNKGVSKDIFAQYGIKTPGGCIIERDKTVTVSITPPVVIKPCSGGSSVGVSIVTDESQMEKAIKEAFKYEETLILEQYIKGREFSVGVIGGKALPIIEICPKSGFYDYKNKYQSGMTDEHCPADLPSEITEKMQTAAIDVFNALRLEGYGRVDFILDEKGDFYCLEANTLPGMTPLSLMPQEAAAVGMSYGELCEKIIEVSMVKYK